MGADNEYATWKYLSFYSSNTGSLNVLGKNKKKTPKNKAKLKLWIFRSLRVVFQVEYRRIKINLRNITIRVVKLKYVWNPVGHERIQTLVYEHFNSTFLSSGFFRLTGMKISSVICFGCLFLWDKVSSSFLVVPNLFLILLCVYFYKIILYRECYVVNRQVIIV